MFGSYLKVFTSWILIFACVTTLSLFEGCSRDKESYLMDDPRSEFYEGLPLPTERDWAFAREELIDFNEPRVRFQSNVQIDFF